MSGAKLSGRVGALGGVVLLCAAIFVALAFGTESVSIAKALSDVTSLDHAIVIGVRLPRVLLACVAGAGLAVVGTSLQAIVRNPLAEPYVLGVSGGSALGATLAIATGLTFSSVWSQSIVSIAAFAGGALATVAVYTLARGVRGLYTTNLLLAGVVVNAIASALITLIKTIVSASKAQELLFWLMGFIGVPSYGSLGCAAFLVACGSGVLLFDAGRLNLLALGDESAEHLGVDVRTLERRTLLASSLVIGSIVSLTGLIGFVGLIVPHALRRIVGPDARLLAPLSLLLGASVLVLCDLASRAAFSLLHTELPVGALTALLGGPLFLLLLRKRV